MITFLVFLSIVLVIAGLASISLAIEALNDPFASRFSDLLSFAAIFLVAPLFFTAAWATNDYRRNYCPALEPIAAPDLAEVGVPVEIVTGDPQELALVNALDAIEGLHETLDKTTAELTAKTSALKVASERILELENEVKRLKAVRIDVKSATQTPVPVQAPRPTCRRGGCN